MKNENRDGLLKTLFVVIGALVSIAALIALAYTLFKKYFQVTFECEGDGGIEDDGDPFAENDDMPFEPICCCDGDEEEAPAEETPATDAADAGDAE